MLEYIRREVAELSKVIRSFDGEAKFEVVVFDRNFPDSIYSALVLEED